MINNLNYQKDQIIGNLNEDYAEEIIKEYLDLKHLIKLDKFDTFDFYNEEKNIFFEVKSRRNNYNKYPTTIIGYNKMLEAINYKNVYFIFIFNDGDYYYKYDVNDNLMITIGGRWDRGKTETKKYVHIPIEKLIKLQ